MKSKKLKIKILASAIWMVYRLISSTWRIRIHETDELKKAMDVQKANSGMATEAKPVVFAHWHGDEMGILHLLKRYRACTMISTSQDGELMANVVELMGAQTSRGSSTRQGVSALKGILRLARHDKLNPSVAVDGPKGPYRKIKPGVFEIAKILQAPIYPISLSVSRRFVFKKAWNKTYLPLPFAKIEIVWGNPIPPPTKDADCHDPQLAKALHDAMLRLEGKARNLIAGFDTQC